MNASLFLCFFFVPCVSTYLPCLPSSTLFLFPFKNTNTNVTPPPPPKNSLTHTPHTQQCKNLKERKVKLELTVDGKEKGVVLYVPIKYNLNMII